MRKKTLAICFISILLMIGLLSSCDTASTSTSQSTTGTSIQTSTITPSSQTNWWDEYGEPQYGGKFTEVIAREPFTFDLLRWGGGGYWYSAPLFEPDWTLDPEVYNTALGFVPSEYCVGRVAENWEITDPQTITVKLREGVTFQNKPPVNGREFTAYDVQYHFERAKGPNSQMVGMLSNWESVTAKDNYTVVFKFKTVCTGTAFHSIRDMSSSFEAREWVEQGDLENWENVVGAGPWMLTDFVSGASMTYTKNPTYWQNDPRFPDNQVPYADTLTSLVITDISTKQAAIRTGKIDCITEVNWQTAQTLTGSNPELVKGGPSPGVGSGVSFRLDNEPFSDIRVRKALQMSIDREAIGSSLFGGFSDITPCGTILQLYKGWVYSYEDWPQQLKDEYSYNPEDAKQLLAEAGYPNGFATNVVQMQGGNMGGDNSVQIMEIFKAYFKDIGIDMEIKVMDATSAENYLRSGKHDQMWGTHAGQMFPPIRVIDMWWSQGSDFSMFNAAIPGWDEAHDKFTTAATEAEAAAAYVAADRSFIEHHVWVGVVEAGTFTFSQPYIKGFGWTHIGMNNMNWDRVWVDQSLKTSMGR